MNKVEKIKAEIERRYEYWKEKESNSHSIESESRMSECQYLLLLFDSLQEDPVSNDLEEAAKNYEEDAIFYAARGISDFFKAGAQWQKERILNNAIEREVKVDAGGYPYIDKVIKLYDYTKDEPLAKEGDKVKLIIIKEE